MLASLPPHGLLVVLGSGPQNLGGTSKGKTPERESNSGGSPTQEASPLDARA